ncbi:DUF5518 domain-containing protein [Halovivax gelatinilyticus]|uniref:DUF5518 domain-containing protein n=1 Tax=Halovivax gelatinilyticus TaxID=2961597 RepID=UPI0020CA977B|nr:DUF5518 domain-containing protein [Halovivax gelatinilyticus]
MSSTPPTDDSHVRQTDRSADSLGAVVDWIVTAFLVLAGLSIAIGGLFASLAADRAQIESLVADGTIEADPLTDAELVDLTYALASTGGLWLVVVGLLTAVAGVVFFVSRRRTRRQFALEERPPPTVGTYALIGGIVTIVASFVPLAPILGGGVSGYLSRDDRHHGLAIGGLAGLVAAAPVVVGFAILLGGLAIAANALGLGFATVAIALAFVLLTMIAALYVVALSALGGFLGAYLARDRRDDRAATDAGH